MYFNLEDKSLTELIEMKRIFSGTDIYFAVDRTFKLMLSQQYSRMIAHCRNRNTNKIKNFSLTSHYNQR